MGRECSAAGVPEALVVGRSGRWLGCTYVLDEGQSEVRLRMKEEGVLKNMQRGESVKVLHCGEGKGIF